MTPFSTLLSGHLNAKNIRTYSLAQYCSIDRSNMYKLIKGKRNPGSEELVHKMADFMRLTPTERKELLEAYKITITGYETYYRRKNVEDFISNFSSHTDDLPDYTDYFSATFDYTNLTDKLSVSGKAKLSQTLYRILALEAQKSHGHIHLLFQPENGDIMDILASISKNRRDLKIDHIICLNNTDTITSEKRNYNLSCLHKIIPMYSTCLCEYTPLCYYDSINSHNSIFNLLSSLIITSDYAILFSPHLQYGILFTRKDTLQKFYSIFEGLKAETTPVVCKIDSIYTQFEYFNLIDLGERTGYSFQKEPCIVPLFPADFPEKYLVRDLSDRDHFVNQAKQYIQKKYEVLKTLNTYFMFTESGIRSFLETGRLFELPDSIYKPIEYTDRILVIRNLISACQNQKYRMVLPDAPIASSNLCIYANTHKGYLLFPSADGQLVFLNLEEPSLLVAFYDYLGSLEEDLFYSTEETLCILKNLLKAR